MIVFDCIGLLSVEDRERLFSIDRGRRVLETVRLIEAVGVTVRVADCMNERRVFVRDGDSKDKETCCDIVELAVWKNVFRADGVHNELEAE